MPSNQALASIQGGVWDDALGPAFALGQGGASPALVAFPNGTTGRLYRVARPIYSISRFSFPMICYLGQLLSAPMSIGVW